MLKKITALILRSREIILYLIFGVMTTIVNFAVYVGCMQVFTGKAANVVSTCIAWFIAVLLAYLTNRKWVFNSKAEGFGEKLKECAAFFAGRIFSGLIDLGIMYLAVDILGFDGKIIKLLSNIIVIIINYILSKFIIFKNTNKKE